MSLCSCSFQYRGATRRLRSSRLILGHSCHPASLCPRKAQSLRGLTETSRIKSSQDVTSCSSRCGLRTLSFLREDLCFFKMANSFKNSDLLKVERFQAEGSNGWPASTHLISMGRFQLKGCQRLAERFYPLRILDRYSGGGCF